MGVRAFHPLLETFDVAEHKQEEEEVALSSVPTLIRTSNTLIAAARDTIHGSQNTGRRLPPPPPHRPSFPRPPLHGSYARVNQIKVSELAREREGFARDTPLERSFSQTLEARVATASIGKTLVEQSSSA